MRILVHEYVTASGLGRDPGSVEHSLYLEGRGMRDSIAADLGRIAGIEVVFDGESDAQIVIAPEFDDIHLAHTREVEASGGNLIGPNSFAVELTSDKLRLAEHWRENGVPTPATSGREPTVCEVFPIVWKPRDGAGSTATFRLDRGTDVARCRAIRAAEGHTGEMIMQEFVSGLAASVAFLTGPGVTVPLSPCLQKLTSDGRFKYEGGEAPLPAPLAERAIALGLRAIACVPGLRGWVGVDLVLGDADDGSRDFVIEINPRLTTSYVGLRKLCRENLAELMVRAANGESVTPSWRPGRVTFGTDGSVQCGMG